MTPVPLNSLAERLEHLISPDRICRFRGALENHRAGVVWFRSARRLRRGQRVDVLVSFNPAATWSLWDLTAMEDELTAIIGRKWTLWKKEALRNPFRRQHILNGRRPFMSVPKDDRVYLWTC